MTDILMAATDKTPKTRMIVVDSGSVVDPVHPVPPDQPPSPDPPQKLARKRER
jgi:hypothetical protein